MRVALSALLLLPGKRGGVEIYFRSLISSLAQLDQENEYIILTNEESFRDLDLPYSNFRKVLVNFSPKSLSLLPRRVVRKVKHILIGRQYQTTFKEDLLAEKVDSLGVDLIHHPFGVIYPLSLSSSNILTFWDMQHEFFPEFFSDDVMFWRKRHYRPSVQLAKYIIVASNFTKETLIANYRVSPDKITTIYIGVGPEFQQRISPDQITKLRAKYGLGNRFIFYPAATFPHKNHIRLVHAFKLLCDKIKDVQLVLTGAEMTNEANLRAVIKALGLEEKVKRLGYVPIQELPVFYAAASLMVFPSLFEGYGIPLIEAMHVGCPIISSNAGSLPELAEDAAIFIDPMDVEAISLSLCRLLTERDLAGELVARGRRRATKFSWQEAARKTIEVYETVRSSGRS